MLTDVNLTHYCMEPLRTYHFCYATELLREWGKSAHWHNKRRVALPTQGSHDSRNISDGHVGCHDIISVRI